MSRTPALACLAAVAALALCGCGGGSGNGGQASSGGHTPVPSSGGTSSEPPASQPPPPSSTVSAPPTTPDRLKQACGNGPVCDDFMTPSGNIRCFAAAQNGGFVECDIQSGLNPAPKKGSCDLEQPGLSVGAGGTARVSCRSDPTPAGFDKAIPPLAYGDSWSGFGVVCHSRITGITCTNAGGHGFFLSRESWRTF